MLGWPWGDPQASDGLCSPGLFTGGGGWVVPSPGAAPALPDLDLRLRARVSSVFWAWWGGSEKEEVSQTDTIHLLTSGPCGLLNLLSHPDLAFAEGLTYTPKCPANVTVVGGGQDLCEPGRLPQ